MVFTTRIALATARRVPMIKFRKGGLALGGAEQSTSAGGTVVSGTPPKSGQPVRASSTAIEDWELPPRYGRKPLDPVEMEYINRGGPP